MRLSLRGLPIAVALAAAALPPRAAAAGRELSLRFSCPDGARVAWTSDEESSIAGGATARRKGTGRARVVREGEACRVELETAPAPPLALVAGAEDGAFVRWDGAEAWLAAAAQEDAGAASAPAAEPPPADAADDPEVASGGEPSAAPGPERGEQSGPGPREAAARAELAREEEVWQEAVARWVGRSAIPARTSEETVAPAHGDPAAVPLRVRWAIRRRLACPGDRRRRCVELWARASPDEDVLRRACAAPRAADEARPPRHVVREVVVVTAPDDLLPRRVRLETTSRRACPGAGPPASTERWTRTWTWAR